MLSYFYYMYFCTNSSNSRMTPTNTTTRRLNTLLSMYSNILSSFNLVKSDKVYIKLCLFLLLAAIIESIIIPILLYGNIY
jgi:hypothetical protein